MAGEKGPQHLASEVDLYPEFAPSVPEMAASETPMPDVAMVLPDPAPTDPVPPDFGPPAPPSVEASVHLKKGDTIARVLGRLGVAAADVAEIVAVLAEHVRMDRLSIGQALTVKLQPSDDDAAAAVVLGLSIRPEPQREFRSSATTTAITASRRRSSRSPLGWGVPRARSTDR